MLKMIATAAVVAAAGTASAQTLVQYQTAPSTSNATLAAEIVAAGLSATDFSAGAGVNAASGGTYNFNGWADGGTANTSAADAFAEDEFFTFGFTNTSTFTASVDSLDIRLDRSGTGPNEVSFQYSIDGGTLVEFNTFNWGDDASGEDFIGVNLGLSLAAGSTIDFYFIAFGADSGGASSNGTFDLETVDFGGSDERAVRVYGVVPAPGAAVLAGVAGLAAVRRRR